MVCRNKYNSPKERLDLIQSLYNPQTISNNADGDGDGDDSIEVKDSKRDPPFEEVKLILGLAWQRGRWDGSDGGAGGYSQVLATMAQAERYETDDEELNSKLLVKDMMDRFHLICSDGESLETMQQLETQCKNDIDLLRRKCSALVLSEMGFIENGL